MSLVLSSSLAACSSTSTVRATAPSTDASRAGNERALTAAQSQRLIDWALDFRSCLARRGIIVAKPEPGSKQITLRVTAAPSGKPLMRPLVQCGDSLGGPPPKSSLQLAGARTFVLYLPKRCLLDPKVARAASA